MKNSREIIAYSAIAGLFLFFAACTSSPTEEVKNSRIFEGYGLWMDTVFRTPEKVIRGFEPGMTIEEIKKYEILQPTEEDSTVIYYEAGADSVTDFSITYQISENKISEIELIVSTENHDNGGEIFNDLKNYLEKKYPGAVTQKGIYVFNGKTTTGQSFKISLEDQSGVDDGKISMLVYVEE